MLFYEHKHRAKFFFRDPCDFVGDTNEERKQHTRDKHPKQVIWQILRKTGMTKKIFSLKDK